MSIGSKNHRANGVARTTMSAASRDMASNRPPRGQFNSAIEEKNYWSKELRNVEEQLRAYSASEYRKVENRIRNECGSDMQKFYQTWRSRRDDLDHARDQLIRYKQQIEARITEMRQLVRREEENAKRSRQNQKLAEMDLELASPYLDGEGRLDWSKMLLQILADQRDIKLMLGQLILNAKAQKHAERQCRDCANGDRVA